MSREPLGQVAAVAYHIVGGPVSARWNAAAQAAYAAGTEADGSEPDLIANLGTVIRDMATVIANARGIGPELDGALKNTQERLLIRADYLETEAANAKAANQDNREDRSRLLLARRAEWCTQEAAVLREIAAVCTVPGFTRQDPTLTASADHDKDAL